MAETVLLEAPVGSVAAPDTIFPFGQAEHDYQTQQTRRKSEVYNFSNIQLRKGSNNMWLFKFRLPDTGEGIAEGEIVNGR